MQNTEQPTTRYLPESLLLFFKRNTVFCVALTAALISALLVLPDSRYLDYIDYKTITCLFCILAVVCALRSIDFFSVIAQKIVSVLKNARLAVIGLVYITFIGSMLIANDMALLTFLPLGYSVLTQTGKQKYMAFVFIMQNIAANLGGMLTPFGNPQNLYLYSKFKIPDGEFLKIMLPHFLLSVAIITLCCFFVKPEPLNITGKIKALPKKETTIYLILFAFSIAIVFKGIPYILGLIIIPAVLYFMYKNKKGSVSKNPLLEVDYLLLLTFVCFFIFAGNIARIEPVKNMFSLLLSKSTLISSVISCQIISNVPTSILLSQFTDNYPALLVGVNIGGVGTLISSLASLITFREFSKNFPGKSGYYLKMFTALNFAFLLLLTAFAFFII